MNDRDRRLCALAAALAPARAAALLARAPDAALAAEAARLALLPRAARLAALEEAATSALAAGDAAAAAALERPALAAALHALAGGRALPRAVAPALVRLCLERLLTGRGADAGVRPAPGGTPSIPPGRRDLTASAPARSLDPVEACRSRSTSPGSAAVTPS